MLQPLLEYERFAITYINPVRSYVKLTICVYYQTNFIGIISIRLFENHLVEQYNLQKS